MPLLGRQPFERTKVKFNTQQLDKEFFYCKHTQEIFLDYESLFQRVIQCNSLIWTCSVTARPGLTFQEAVESERKARSTLATFPESLKQPVLYIATLTKRNRIGDLCDDVYNFARNRYFVGEKVEFVSSGERKSCEVTAVCPTPNGKSSKSPRKNGPSHTKDANNDPGKQKYELFETDDAEEIQMCHIVEGKDITRQKGSFNKTTNKLFIKQHVTLKGGTLVVKDNSIEKYELDSPSLKKITGHEVPNFTTLKGSPNGKLKNGQMEITKAFTQKSTNKKKDRTLLSPEEVQKRFEERRKEKLMEREKEREQMREEKLLIARFKTEWNKPRDDLECDDLKDLPLATKVKCNIPEEIFGEALAILEFVHQYSTLLKAKRIYPSGLTFGSLEKALENPDIDGPFNDLLQLLLLAVLRQQEEEGEEQVGIKDLSKTIPVSDELMDDEEDVSTTKAVLSAKIAASWPQYYHGTILRKMPLDSFTLTEMLRLHLLASGSEVFPRFYERGMYVSQENPGLYFKIEHPEIIKILSTSSVFQLNAVQRVKVLNVLIEQLLTYESYREHIEISAKKLKNALYALKQLRWARRRRSKEEKIKKKPDDKIKDANDEINMDENSPEVELTPEQKALEDAKFLESSLKKEKELVSQIEKLHSVSALHPIGLDRAYRRYWVFKSVGGIFVEDNDPFIGVCLPRPTPSQSTSTLAKNQDELPLSFMRKYLNTQKREDKNGQSDKENDSGDVSGTVTSSHNHAKAQKLLSDANPRINSPLKVKRHLSSTSSDGADDKDFLKRDFVCTADPVSCPVHGTNKSKPRIPWSVYYTEEDVDNLISTLNPRGFREGKLIEFLKSEKINLVSNMSNCPVNKLVGELLMEEPAPEVRKSNRLKSVFYNIHPEEALLSTFRDALLENEEKLWSGSLGIVKVHDRKAWKQAILDGEYDMQAEVLKWSNNGKRLNGSSLEAMDCGNSDDDKLSQRSTSPSLVASPFIVDLASALLQVAQGVEHRYLIAPLADDDKFKKQKQKIMEKQEKTKKTDSNHDDEVMDNSGKGSIKSPMQRWEESLMLSTSISQLFIHLATLERSISWNKAAKHASCRICRKRGDPENMLLCDGCDKGYHMYCLKPPITSIPTGDWFCPPCEPLPPKESRSVVKSYKELSDSEGDEEDAEEEQEDDEEADNEEKVDDVSEEEEEEEDEDNAEVVNGEVSDEEVENDEASDGEVENDEEASDGEVENNEEASDGEVYDDEEDAVEASGDETDFCLKCKKGGDLICCDSCPASFHLDCCDPPLKRVPRGTWCCPVCSGKRTYKPSKRSKSPEQESPSSSRSSRRLSNDTNGLPLDYNNCSKLLTLLSQHKDSWPFLKAVTKKQAPDYHKIIKRPTDLGIIRSRLNNQTYLNNSQFIADVYLMFQNCEVYNASESQQYTSGKRLARYFQSLLRQYKLEDSNKRLRESDTIQLPAKRSRN